MSDEKQYPKLRTDLKISRAKNQDRINYVIKDPLKGEFFRFEQDEWEIISLFDGEHTLPELVTIYNEKHPLKPIEAQTLIDFQEGLNGMHLLIKSKHETNVMLIEKMKEMRKSQLLSKKGSLFYKRFPVIDPDELFNKYIPRLTFFWTRGFFVISLLIMVLATLMTLSRLDEFNEGMRQLFSFSNMSWINMLTLWVIIYVTIAIHEFGHGLTCKYYGGEVHEIGFLLLFFQPCLYCNVNDAWLFDKKWKQIMVTMAGGYIEFFIGALFTFIWFFTNPNTFIHVISLQVMIICSVSTILFNFNPMVKLDGYYLLSDLVEIPNLKDKSIDFVKNLVKKKIFYMPVEEEIEASSREQRILLIYGVASIFWMTSLTLGLWAMARNILVDYFFGTGILVSLWVAYKLFGDHIKSAATFMAQWGLKNKALFKETKIRWIIGCGSACLMVVLAFPVTYKIYGDCVLDGQFSRVIRASSDAKLVEYSIRDGQTIKYGQPLAKLENFTLPVDRQIASLALDKAEIKFRSEILKNKDKIQGLRKELEYKKLQFAEKNKQVRDLNLVYTGPTDKQTIVTCKNYVQNLNSFLKQGDEICRVYGTEKLKSVIEVTEQDMRFLQVGQNIKFVLYSGPLDMYEGKITAIRSSSTKDPKNPLRRLYYAEVILDNPGNLRPQMSGKAKIYGHSISLFHHLGLKLASTLRLDLFL